MAKKTKGRQKIDITKIENQNHLFVTFSKRRSGLFKKANELSTLCGVEIVVVVFSPGRKVYSFGHPNVETIVDRFLSWASQQSNETVELSEANSNSNARDLNAQITQALNQLELEKKLGSQLDDVMKARCGQNWWESSIDQMNMPQIKLLKEALETLKEDIASEVEKFRTQGTN